jgi:nitroreductase
MSTTVETLNGTRKPAPAEAEIHELVRERWSPRSFSSRSIGAARLRSLLEAARWASSSMNEQPWAIVVADRAASPQAHAAVVSTLMPANAAWAAQAPALLVVSSKTTFARNGAPNRWALYDTGQAVAQLVLQAGALGLAAHQMGGFDAAKASESLGIPAEYEPVVVVALGEPGDASALAGELRARELAPRERKPVSQWAHDGAWGAPWQTSARS